MALEDLEKKLYQKEEKKEVPEERPAVKPQTKPEEAQIPKLGKVWGEVPEKPKITYRIPFEGRPKTRKIISFGLGFLGIAIIGFFVFQYFFAPPKIELTVSGPDEVIAGEEVEYEITFDNNSRGVIKDGVFVFKSSPGAVLADAVDQFSYEEEIGEVLPQSKGRASVSLIFVGEPKEKRQFSVSFRYLFGKSNKSFDVTKNVDVKIISSATSLDFVLPERVIPDDAFRFQVMWRNNSPTTFRDVELALEFPAGITLLEGKLVSGLQIPAPVSAISFVRDLTLNSVGEDVRALQEFLNSQGFYIAESGPGSPGNETVTFGVLTRDALARFQRANSISPAAGYFGPLTRSRVNELAGGPPSQPSAQQNLSQWQIAELLPGATGQVNFVGKISGSAGETKRFFAKLEVVKGGERTRLHQTEARLVLTPNPLSAVILVNGKQEYTASLKEGLEYRISFRNNFDVPLRDVVVKAKLEGVLYNLATVETSGAFSSRDKVITWHGGNQPKLSSLNTQESGVVTFKVKVRDSFVKGSSQNTLRVVVDISSPTRPPSLGGEAMVSARAENTSKVNGQLLLDSIVLRRDRKATFSNTGPIPPRANYTTQYSSRIKVTANGNAFRNIFAKTILPTGVTFTGKTSGDIGGTEFAFNPRTNEISWQIPILPAFTTKEIIFQISATPSVNQIGSIMLLLDAVDGGGIDDFTEKEVVLRDEPISSDLPDDPNISYTQGVVQP